MKFEGGSLPNEEEFQARLLPSDCNSDHSNTAHEKFLDCNYAILTIEWFDQNRLSEKGNQNRPRQFEGGIARISEREKILDVSTWLKHDKHQSEDYGTNEHKHDAIGQNIFRLKACY
jgi:hypothetical protein